MRTTAIGLLFVAGTMFCLAAGALTAVAQPVRGSGAAPGARQPARGGTDIEARKEFESSGAAQRRAPCDQVIGRINRDTNVQQGHAADISIVAKELGTSVMWVERCMLAYGRRVKRPGMESAESTEQRLESFEEDEIEESGPEDVEGRDVPNRRERPEGPERPMRLRTPERD